MTDYHNDICCTILYVQRLFSVLFRSVLVDIIALFPHRSNSLDLLIISLLVLLSNRSTFYFVYLYVHFTSALCLVHLSSPIAGSPCQVSSMYAFHYFCRCACWQVSGYPYYRVMHSLVILSSAALADCCR